MSLVARVTWISGPVVRAEVTGPTQMMEQVTVSDYRLVGEVIGLRRDIATIQVYEDTSGVRPGDPVYGTGAPLSVELGPGLIGNIFDGIQRPLETLADVSGNFIERGVTVASLDRGRQWAFEPTAAVGSQVSGGMVLGTVPETPLVIHRVMVPPNVSGTLTWLAPTGEYTLTEPVARILSGRTETEITMMHRWAVRVRRPTAQRQSPTTPLITGQRVIDTLFPIAKGGTATVPGGFGAGKTVLQHALAKWSDADIVI